MPSGTRYIEGPSAGRGKGLFASTEFRAGNTILEEAAVITVHEDATPLHVHGKIQELERTNYEEWARFFALSHGGDLPQPEIQSLSDETGPVEKTRLDVWVESIEQARDADHASVTAQFPSLNCRYTARSFAKFTDNCFKIGNTQKGLFLDAARLNHSCVPNCWASWNSRIGKLCVHAVYDINEGQELSIAYDVDIVDLCLGETESVFFQYYEVRQARLMTRYGFHCDCKACRKKSSDKYSWYDDETDRETIARLAEEIRVEAKKNEAVNSNVLSSSKKMLELMIKHGGDTWEAGRAYYALVKLYEEWLCLEYAADNMPKAFQLAVQCLGKDHSVTDFLRAERDRVMQLEAMEAQRR